MAERVIAGQCALVTGGARGIGRATAEQLVREGLRVVVTDIDGEGALRAATELSALRLGAGVQPSVRGMALDVRDAAAFGRLVEEIERDFAPVDVLVNNAGIMPIGPFLEQDPAQDDRQIDINLRGVIHGMRAVLPRMVQRRRGHVVNIASVVGRVPTPYIAVYSATKHAVVGLTEAVRHEHEDTGVLFSYVLPSFVNTELTSGTGRVRYPPPVEPGDVAAAVVRALRYGLVDVYVPRFGKLGALLPALLPRRVVERIGRWFGVDRVFREIDHAGRAAYESRISR
jgi:NAD(P)-dependent dehydrogenase (short-subunit alcohol dehydrogenase family)